MANLATIINERDEHIDSLKETIRELENELDELMADALRLKARNQELEKIYDEWVGYQLAEH